MIRVSKGSKSSIFCGYSGIFYPIWEIKKVFTIFYNNKKGDDVFEIGTYERKYVLQELSAH